MADAILRIAFAAVLGGCFGSFANVLAIRLHTSSSLTGRSHCPACEKPIRPRHLVPVFSWLALRGKCADCNAEIHIQYPIVELIAMLLAVIAALRFDPFSDPRFYAEMLLGIGLLVLVVMDVRWKELSLELMAVIGIAGLIIRLSGAVYQDRLIEEVIFISVALAVAVGFFGVQWIVSKGRWLGSGDVWFGAMIALLVGWPGTATAIYLAYLVGGLSVACLVIVGVVKRGMRVPFGPALAIGVLLSLWFGQRVEAWFAYAFTS
ncbi:MAG: prepilin peptidase [Patescibacteria group bacterium]|jgi:prepilin signal peptidase PulO-like enzyme (type II secretory pathway)